MEKVKSYDELELKDDFMFGKVMGNKELCKKLLETLLETTITDISYTEREKTIRITKEKKDIRLDVYVRDDKDRVYDAEMQQKHKNEDLENLPMRSRYYQGMIDLNLLESGASYAELPDSYIIFICTFDPFGAGLSRYTFGNICEEDKRIHLGDRTAKIFFNTKGDEADISKETKAVLRYIENHRAEDTFTRELDKEVRRIKENKTWRREYMKSVLYWQEVREEGREDGIQEGMKEGIKALIFDNLEEGRNEETIINKLIKRFHLKEAEAKAYFEEFSKEI